VGGAVARYKLKLKYKHKRKHSHQRQFQFPGPLLCVCLCVPSQPMRKCCCLRVCVCICVMLTALLVLPLSLARTVVVCRRGWLFHECTSICVCVWVAEPVFLPPPPITTRSLLHWTTAFETAAKAAQPYCIGRWMNHAQWIWLYDILQLKNIIQ